MKIVSHVGSWLYDILLSMNAAFNKVRGWFGMEYWSLSHHIKVNTKEAVKFCFKFENALAFGSSAGEKIFFHPGNDLTLHPLLNKGEGTKNTKSISIFIGPEGGFTDKEIKFAEKADYKVASLGPLILRGETAAIVATYLAVHSHTTP